MKIRRKFISDNLVKSKTGRINWIKSVGLNFSIIYNDITYDFVINSYDKKSQNVYVQYNDKEFMINTANILTAGIGGIIGTYIENNYKFNVGEIVNNNKILDQIRHNQDKGYKIECIKCGYIRNIREPDLIRGHGCSVCSNKMIIKGINDINTTHPYISKWLYNKEDGYNYSFGSGKKLDWICPNCGNVVKQVEPYVVCTLNHIPCQLCSDGFSYPEKVMTNILNQLNVHYISHYRIKNGKILFRNKYFNPEYDIFFVFDGKKYIVEMDGGFHSKVHGCSNKSLEEIKYIDKQKDILASDNDYHLIRIDSSKSDFRYIMNNLKNSELSKIFNFDNIDEQDINEKAYSSKIKEVCEIYKNDNLITIAEISSKTGLSRPTVLNYLKKGTKLNWCNYTIEDSYKRSGLLKQVICLNTYRIFKSIKEAKEWSNGYNISSCCNGRLKTTGKHPETGEKLRWMYYDDYLKQNNAL